MPNLETAIILFMLGVLLLVSLGAFIEERFPRVRNRSKWYVHPPKRKARQHRKGVRG